MNPDNEFRRPLLQDSEQGYDPFAAPPNLELAERHRLAMSVGVEPLTTDVVVERCPCCHHAINKTPLSICCSELELCFMGVGHPLYYRMTKYFAAIIVLMFISSGGIVVLISNLQCKEACAQFFGIPIMKLEALDENPELKTQWFNLLTCILLMLGVLYAKSVINKDIETFSQRLVCPSDYSIMLQNLPQSVRQDELRQWTAQLAGVHPVKINLSYELGEYQQAYDKKEQLSFRLNRLRIEGESLQLIVPFDKNKVDQIERDIEKLTLQLEQQNKIMREFNSEGRPPTPTGTAFVSFEEKATVEQLIEKWGDSFAKAVGNCLFGYIRSPYPICRGQYVLLSKAPSPTDIIWQNLSFSFVRNLFFEALSYLLMAVIILLAFRLQYKMVSVAFELKMEGKKPGRFVIAFLSLSMSLIVLILNMLLRLVIQKFCQIQRHHSYTRFNAAFANSYLLMYFINTCFTVYIVHGNWIDDSEQVLLWDIHLILLTNAFSQPLAKIFDPTLYYRHFMRWIVRTKRPSPYLQKQANEYWEGHPMSVADNYQFIGRILLISVWFGYAAPLGTVFSLVAMFINYWVDKFFLVKVNKIPEAVSASVADKILAVLELLPLLYMCGTLQYTYKFGQSTNVFDFLAKFLNYGIVFVVIVLSMFGYALLQRRRRQDPPPQVSYQEAQYLFLYDYDSENPITRYQSQLNFLNRLLKSKSLDEQSNDMVRNVLNRLERKTSVQELEQSRAQIIQLKQKLASERLQWHKYNAGGVELMSLSKGSSDDGSKRHQ